jgi:hypothetical protein
MLVDFHGVAAAKFLPAGGSCPNHFRNAVLGAMSLIHSSMAASAFLTPRGHSRSINMRVPSEDYRASALNGALRLGCTVPVDALAETLIYSFGLFAAEDVAGYIESNQPSGDELLEALHDSTFRPASARQRERLAVPAGNSAQSLARKKCLGRRRRRSAVSTL